MNYKQKQLSELESMKMKTDNELSSLRKTSDALVIAIGELELLEQQTFSEQLAQMNNTADEIANRVEVLMTEITQLKEAIDYRNRHGEIFDTIEAPFKEWQVRRASEVRELLKEIFKTLRKEGWVTKMNHLCCSSCALSSISQQIKKTYSKSAKIPKAIIFWHNQDEIRKSDGYGDYNYESKGVLDLRYCDSFNDSYMTEEEKEQTISSLQIAERITELLRENLIPYIWGGSTDETIRVVFGNATDISQMVHSYYRLKTLKLGFSNRLIFEKQFANPYLSSSLVFGWFGHSARTPELDQYLEEEFLKLKLLGKGKDGYSQTDEIRREAFGDYYDGGYGHEKTHYSILSCWLTSTSARHFLNDIEDLTLIQQKKKIKKELKNIYNTGLKYILDSWFNEEYFEGNDDHPRFKGVIIQFPKLFYKTAWVKRILA